MPDVNVQSDDYYRKFYREAKAEKRFSYFHRTGSSEAKDLSKQIKQAGFKGSTFEALGSGYGKKWQKDFYDYYGSSPTLIKNEYLQYFEGQDLAEYGIDYGKDLGFNYAYFTSSSPESLAALAEAKKRYETEEAASKLAKASYGRFGQPYGLKPFSKKRPTPFSIEQSRLREAMTYLSGVESGKQS